MQASHHSGPAVPDPARRPGPRTDPPRHREPNTQDARRDPRATSPPACALCLQCDLAVNDANHSTEAARQRRLEASPNWPAARGRSASSPPVSTKVPKPLLFHVCLLRPSTPAFFPTHKHQHDAAPSCHPRLPHGQGTTWTPACTGVSPLFQHQRHDAAVRHAATALPRTQYRSCRAHQPEPSSSCGDPSSRHNHAGKHDTRTATITGHARGCAGNAGAYRLHFSLAARHRHEPSTHSVHPLDSLVEHTLGTTFLALCLAQPRRDVRRRGRRGLEPAQARSTYDRTAQQRRRVTRSCRGHATTTCTPAHKPTPLASPAATDGERRAQHAAGLPFVEHLLGILHCCSLSIEAHGRTSPRAVTSPRSHPKPER